MRGKRGVRERGEGRRRGSERNKRKEGRGGGRGEGEGKNSIPVEENYLVSLSSRTSRRS